MFSQELMARVARYMDEYGFRTTLHYAEEKSDVAAIRAATGLTPAQFLRSSGAARPEMLLVPVSYTHLPGSLLRGTYHHRSALF